MQIDKQLWLWTLSMLLKDKEEPFQATNDSYI